MINPVTVMKVLSERKVFLENHPDLYPFIKKWFGNDLQKGTVLEIAVKEPGEESGEKIKIEIKESEQVFFHAVKDMLK
ncbi:hypothetical protein H8S37_15870 [Mediterraneibacter sp. NSJ-55]|uniref:Uncharacterized protein n=1 Tax=Mediterraneibacter hominis TaxID=2763054 RepID=A0A923RRB1_9FIRM|nr:hypothetical protein [Mediterraneibacter hominis]MBC5690391.1 hypothetical protein [Mediterraneibacter hominis]